jgi:hypothetical protein
MKERYDLDLVALILAGVALLVTLFVLEHLQHRDCMAQCLVSESMLVCRDFCGGGL